MRKTLSFIVSLLFVLITQSCGTQTSPDSTLPPVVQNPDPGVDPDPVDTYTGPKLDKKYWGEWIRFDSKYRYYLSDRQLTVYPDWTTTNDKYSIGITNENKFYSRFHSFTFIADDIMDVIESNNYNYETRSYYLYRVRGPKSSFSGDVKYFSDTRGPGLNGLGGIQVIITNTSNLSDQQTVITDENGSYTGAESIAGDQYVVDPVTTLGQDINPVVKPNENQDNVGSVTVSNDTYNFKSTVTLPNQTYFYGDSSTNSIKLVVSNSGYSATPEVNYTLVPDAGLTLSSSSGTISSIPARGSQDIALTVSSGAFEEEYLDKKIQVQFQEAGGRIWVDSVSVRFYKRSINLNIYTDGHVEGVVFGPENKYLYFDTYGSITLRVPAVAEKYYFVVTDNSTTSYGTGRYTIGIDIPAPSINYSESWGNNYEPNNTLNTSQDVYLNSEVKAWTISSDLDFYGLVSGGAPGPLEVPVLQASDGAYKDKIVVSWNAVSDAELYYVYRDGVLLTPDGIAETTYSDSTVLEAFSYSYTVKAYARTRGYSLASTADMGYRVSYELQRIIGSQGSALGQFGNIHGLMLDSSGQLIIGDTVNYRVQIQDSVGNFSAFGEQGTSPGQFKYVEDVGKDSEGSFYVLDYERRCVLKFDATKTFQKEWCYTGPSSQTLNRLLVKDIDEFYVGTFNSSSPESGSLILYYNGNNPYQEWKTVYAKAMVIGSDGYIHILTSDKKITRYDFAGTAQSFITVSDYVSGYGGGISLGYITDFEMDSNGNYYLGYSDGYLQKYDSSGTFLTRWKVTAPSFIAVSSGGEVYVVSNKASVYVFKEKP